MNKELCIKVGKWNKSLEFDVFILIVKKLGYLFSFSYLDVYLICYKVARLIIFPI
jgi:hypothetical protein